MYRLIPNSTIAVIGDFPGEQEVKFNTPFVGAAGQELSKMLAIADIDMDTCSLLNTFTFRPPRNDAEYFFQKEKNGVPLRKGCYVKPEFESHVLRLRETLTQLRPNIIIALGNVASWAMLDFSGISKIRGTVMKSIFNPALKVIPTYHPAAVLRQWEFRPIAISDFTKAKRESLTPEYTIEHREIYIDPTLEDLQEFFNAHLRNAERIAFDIETRGGMISCIGFAPTPHISIVVPFSDRRRANGSYWETPAHERRAWDFVRCTLQLPCPKTTQNGLYDIIWLWKTMGMFPAGFIDDTMIMHHAMYPEMEKSLGFLGSIYTNTPPWKLMRDKSEKRDDA